MERVSDQSFRMSMAIARVISGEASDVERQAVEGWKMDSEENRRLLERLLDPGQLARRVDIYRMIDKKSAFQGFLKEKNRLEVQRRSVRMVWVLRVAAVLILPLLVGGVYLFRHLPVSEEIEVASVITPGGKCAVLRLSDNSAIELGKDNVVLSERNGTLISSEENGGLVYRKNAGDSVVGLIYNTLEVPSKGEFYMQLSDGTKGNKNRGCRVKRRSGRGYGS